MNTSRKILCFGLLAIVASWLPMATTTQAAVVGFINVNAAPGGSFDNFMVNFMESVGNTIIRGDQNTPLNDPMYATVDAFIISDAVSSGTMDATVSSLGGAGGVTDPRPIIFYESGVMDAFGIGNGTSYRRFGGSHPETDLDLRNFDVDLPGHPLLGGLTGSPLTIFTGDPSDDVPPAPMPPPFEDITPARIHGIRTDSAIAAGFVSVLSTVPSSGAAPFTIPTAGASPELITLGFVPQGGALIPGTVGGDTAAGLRIVPFFNDNEDPLTLTPEGFQLTKAVLSFAGIAIPEPSSMVLLLFGVAAIAGRRKQRA